MNATAGPITKAEALQICEEIREQYRGKFWTLAGLQCWGCTTFTKGDIGKRCFANAPDFRGCNLVNDRYDQRNQKG